MPGTLVRANGSGKAPGRPRSERAAHSFRRSPGRLPPGLARLPLGGEGGDRHGSDGRVSFPTDTTTACRLAAISAGLVVSLTASGLPSLHALESATI